ncbi:transmembrane protein 41A-A-like protein, partial [Dinothrombium tinctorium]
NLISGSLFGITIGFILSCVLTAVGASFCYLLSKFCGKQLIVEHFPSRIAFLKQTIDDSRSRLIYILLFLRLFPITPNWFLNIASPIIDIPLHLFFASVFFGLMPYNFVCVQTGCILSQLNSLDDVLSKDVLLKLVLIALVVLIPSFIIKKDNKLRNRET